MGHNKLLSQSTCVVIFLTKTAWLRSKQVIKYTIKLFTEHKTNELTD